MENGGWKTGLPASAPNHRAWAKFHDRRRTGPVTALPHRQGPVGWRGKPQAGTALRKEHSVPDICDLVLDEHDTFRRRFAELDEMRDADADSLLGVWSPLAELLELHAAVEEDVFYPTLLDTGTKADEETRDAINDHNEIRDAVERAGDAEAGSEAWWKAVTEAREQNSDHMAEEERGAIADLRAHVSEERRAELGARWVSFRTKHAGLRGIEVEDRDPDQYIREHD